MSSSSSSLSSLPSVVSHYVSLAHRTGDKWLTYGDPRVKDWPLMNFYHMLIVCVGYLLLIPLLAYLMKFRQHPFNVKTFATLHNINLTALSLYMVIEILRQAYTHHYSLFGNGVDHSKNGEGMMRVLYIFYMSKTLEFIDTVIMCLKKNYHQISFLHMYHHSSIFFIWWVIVYYAPGGEAYFSAALNSFIHVIMYSYYLWSTYATKLPAGQRAGPTHPAYYKQYITTMQMTQFALMLGQATYDLLVPNPYPRFCIWILFFYMLTMLALFANFFIHSYTDKKKKKKDKSDSSATVSNTQNNHRNSKKTE